MNELAQDIQVEIAVGEHHALGPRSGAAGVIDREHVALRDFREVELAGLSRQRILVIDPSRFRSFERDEMFDLRQFPAHAIHCLQVIRMSTDDAGTAVLNDVGEVCGVEAVVDGYDDGADLGHRVIRFEVCVGVGCDVGHAVARANTEVLQSG